MYTYVFVQYVFVISYFPHTYTHRHAALSACPVKNVPLATHWTLPDPWIVFVDLQLPQPLTPWAGTTCLTFKVKNRGNSS